MNTEWGEKGIRRAGHGKESGVPPDSAAVGVLPREAYVHAELCHGV